MRHKAVTTCEEWIHVYRDGSATCFFSELSEMLVFGSNFISQPAYFRMRN